MIHFPPDRSTATDRLAAFAPNAGAAYAAKRNYDRQGDVSALSPYLRHRIITEEEVLRAVLEHHSPQGADKFIAEVYWRTYWKGWLEHRPTVWLSYKSARDSAWNEVQTAQGLRQNWEVACKGHTGIAAFDHWARELIETGYLHNHARMWFASIWIFTLRLPWALGADFFLRHLLDGDPASNTLSWRWVAGLQTQGKAYAATAQNIEKYTEGRFRPDGLEQVVTPLQGEPHPALGPLPVSDVMPDKGRPGLLITEEDLQPGWMTADWTASARVQVTSARSHLHVAPQVTDFVAAAMAEHDAPAISPDRLADWAQENRLTHVVTSYVPTGPTRDVLAPIFGNLDIPVLMPIRPYDQAAWPHATKGFFKFKDAIPNLLARL